MIVILSQAGYEPTTELVMEWLHSRGVSVERINADDLNGAQPFSLAITQNGFEASLSINGRAIHLNEASAVWFRRWRLDIEPNYLDVFLPEDREFVNLFEYKDHLTKEFRTLSGAFFSLMSGAGWLGRSSAYHVLNKLMVLQAAVSTGLEIPASLVSASPERARAFRAQHGDLITKPLSNLLMVSRNERLYMSYTTTAKLDLSPEEWKGGLPSFFQEKLDKRYELRCFYLDGECHTMATIAEPGHVAKTDWRRLQSFNLARRVPFKLPNDIEARIVRLMNILELDTGSLDFVRTSDGRFVFLEVNPVGQFGMTSIPCNYGLEEKVANALIRRSEHRHD